MENWHNVEDTLPAPGQNVWICLHGSGKVEPAIYQGNGGSWKSPDRSKEYGDIISWVPREEGEKHPQNPAP